MTFEEYWHLEYPPLYEVGKAVARAAWEAASLDADEARAELDTRRENLELCQKRLITTETERNTYRAALEEIRANYGHVCTEFELCEHPACESSYGAWATADEALRGITRVTDENAQLRAELRTVLDVCIERGGTLGYSDDDYQERLEEFIQQKVAGGASILGVYPPDDTTKAEYAAWRAQQPGIVEQ